MGKVQYTHHAKNQGQAWAEHKKQQPIAHAIQQWDDEKLHKLTFGHSRQIMKNEGPAPTMGGPFLRTQNTSAKTDAGTKKSKRKIITS